MKARDKHAQFRANYSLVKGVLYRALLRQEIQTVKILKKSELTGRRGWTQGVSLHAYDGEGGAGPHTLVMIRISKVISPITTTASYLGLWFSVEHIFCWDDKIIF